LDGRGRAGTAISSALPRLPRSNRDSNSGVAAATNVRSRQETLRLDPTPRSPAHTAEVVQGRRPGARTPRSRAHTAEAIRGPL